MIKTNFVQMELHCLHVVLNNGFTFFDTKHLNNKVIKKMGKSNLNTVAVLLQECTA